MEQRTGLALALVGVATLLLGTFVVAPYAQTMYRGSNRQMMNNCGTDMMGGGNMGGMMSSMNGHCQGNRTGSGNYSSANSLVISNYSFKPQTFKVRAGTTVTWTNMDTVAHSVVSGPSEAPTGLFESTLLGHMQSFSYAFSTLGTFVYHCGPHPYMTGTIVVE